MISKDDTNIVILNKLAKNIKDLRIATSLSQEDLSLKAGVSLKTIINIEQGKNIKLDVFLNILRALGCLENLNLLIEEQEISPELIFHKKPPRKRVSKKKQNKTNWVWGEDK